MTLIAIYNLHGIVSTILMTENSVRQRKYCSSNFLFAEALSLELAAFASAGELRLLLLYLIFGLTLHQFMSESFAPKFVTCCG